MVLFIFFGFTREETSEDEARSDKHDQDYLWTINMISIVNLTTYLLLPSYHTAVPIPNYLRGTTQPIDTSNYF